MGSFIKIVEETKNKRYTAYARICVYMHLAKVLLDSVSLWHEYFEWIQSIYCERVPFYYRKCHMHGHLFRDCPLNSLTQPSGNSTPPDSDGFTKVAPRKWHAKKSSNTPAPSQPSTSNNFSFLANIDVDLNQPSIPPQSTPIPSPAFGSIPPLDIPLLDLTMQHKTLAVTQKDKKLEIPSLAIAQTQVDLPKPRSNIEIDPQVTPSQTIPLDIGTSMTPISYMDEESKTIDFGDLNLTGLEKAYKSKEYHTIPPREIDNLEEALLKAQLIKGSTQLGVQGEHIPREKINIIRESRKKGRPMDLQRMIILGD